MWHALCVIPLDKSTALRSGGSGPEDNGHDFCVCTRLIWPPTWTWQCRILCRNLQLVFVLLLLNATQNKWQVQHATMCGNVA